METKRNFRIRNALMALGAGLVAALAVVPVVHAAEEEATELDRVQITGTRLTQLQVEGANPVTVVTRDDLTRLPFDSLGQLLQALPSFSGSPINTFTNNSGNGSSALDLRGLGAARTLVLINGRRGDAADDLNSVPIAMVERVEILKEGASAIYGADAVAGVINIITRDDYEGMELSVQHSNWQQVDGPTWRVSGITGGNTDRGNFVVGFDFVDQDGVFQGEMDGPAWLLKDFAVFDPESFQRHGLIFDESNPNFNTIPLGSSSIPGGRFFLADGRDLTLDYTGPSDGTGEYAYDEDTFTGVYRDYVGGGPNNDSYNYQPVNYMQTPSKRISFFLQGNYSINSNLTAFMEAQFQRRESSQILAPLPYFGDFGDPGFALSGSLEGTNGASADNFYNPFGQEVSIRRRVVETGGRKFFQTQDTYRTVLGVEGLIGDRWGYEVSYNYSETLRADTDFGQFYGPRLADALGPSFEDAEGNIVCGTPGNVIDGCVPLNLFGGPGTITQEMMDYVSVALNDRIDSRTDVINATINGDLFEGWAGPIQGAFGIERRREKLRFVPDSSKNFDAVTGNTGEGTSGSKEIDSYFVEFGVPLLADAPLAESLTLNTGFRRDNTDIFGSASSFNVGLKWQPISDVMVRATVGESFREPGIFDLYAGLSDSFPAASDPCGRTNIHSLTEEQVARCVEQGVPFTDDGNDDNDGWANAGVVQLRSKVGGNPDVNPEEGESFTLGIGWSPSFINGFSLVIDYWDFEVNSPIGAATAQTVLDSCILEGLTQYCGDIQRNQVTGRPDLIITAQDNLGTLTAKGIDIELNFAHGAGFGDFDHRLLITHLMERKQQELPGLPFNSLEGQFDNKFVGDAAFPELRMTYTADWSLGQWGASARLEFIDSLVEQNKDVNFEAWEYGEYKFDIDSVFYLDLTGHWYATSSTTVDFGITNVTDEEPPFINSAFNSDIDESTYRPMGTGYFFRVTQTF